MVGLSSLEKLTAAFRMLAYGFPAFGRFRKIKDKETHLVLRNSLIDHLWERYTNGDV